MLILGIESSCDDTGVAFYDSGRGLLGHRVHTQSDIHADYGGVVPELASRDHVRRLLPLIRDLSQACGVGLSDLDGIAYTQGPGLAGALLVGAATAVGLSRALEIPVMGVHHLEGHLLSPLLSDPAPGFPFIALLVSGGHTQLMEVAGVGCYTLLGETVDDAAGEAFDKTAQLLGLGYPGGAALAALAQDGDPERFPLPRPMLDSPDLNFSFSGLKTAVRLLIRQRGEADRPDIAAAFQEAVAEVLAAKASRAWRETGHRRFVVAGGVGANHRLRERLSHAADREGVQVYYPPPQFCTDNGAMIALAGALRLERQKADAAATMGGSFTVRPRWPLEELR